AGKIDLRYFAAGEKQGSNAFEFVSRGEILFGAAALHRSERQTEISFNHRLGQSAPRDVSAGMGRGEQCSIPGERRTQLSHNVDVSANIQVSSVFTDRIVRDEALLSRLARRQPQSRRGVQIAERCGDVR